MERRSLLIPFFEKLKQSNDPIKLKSGLEILYKLCNNIINNPTEQKFHTINCSNKVIAERLLSLNDIKDLLIAIGFDFINPNYTFNMSKSDNISFSLGVMQQYIEESNRRAYEIQQANIVVQDPKIQKEIQRIQKIEKEKKDNKERILKAIEDDKKERKRQEEIKKLYYPPNNKNYHNNGGNGH